MFELSEEETLMVSSDNSVKLTSHRFIYESEKGRQQIMLEDFESVELKRNSIGAYGVLLAFLVFFSLYLTYAHIDGYINQGRNPFTGNKTSLIEYFAYDTGYIVLLLILMIVHFFYRISRRNMITIKGKYNIIEFRVKSFRNKSVQRMLNRLIEQSNRVKNLRHGS